MTDKPILLVEDTPSIQALLAAMLRADGHEVVPARSATEALARFRQIGPSIVVMDLHLPDGDGEDLIKEFLEAEPDTRIVAITSDSSVSRAVACMKAGACDFLVKPVRDTQLHDAVNKARAERNRTRTEADDIPLIGSSPAFTKALDLIRSVSRFDAPVFLTGESGTGKSAAAHVIHQLSNRAATRFVTVDCAALDPGASDPELCAVFAMTSGTLFLDHICDLDLGNQARLLKLIESTNADQVNPAPDGLPPRIICATNRDPHSAIRSGAFREDLFYRLFAVPIQMPALRNRGQDVLDIARHQLGIAAAERRRPPMRLSETVEAMLPDLPWRGNVREVLNLMRQIVMLNDGPEVTIDMLPDHVLPGDDPGDTPPEDGGLAGMTLAEVERMTIERAIERAEGSVPRAARELDVSPSTLYRKLEAWARRDNR